MPEQDCQMCPTLEARLAATAGGLLALAAFIDQELTEPTISRRELLDVTAVRAANLADQAQGRY
ncbi:hypothetical protein [Micromonospora sp. U21]|uniref:hypothetical protein n=1 Tax=Micromonospora sp. U21 TaxID=2824899 RepID=UPI001B373F68|nr:hypothetical protein [Micromonospora sp. U21]MBQ0902686.1 hypothetical protein [Micromonospora sp. U21]